MHRSESRRLTVAKPHTALNGKGVSFMADPAPGALAGRRQVVPTRPTVLRTKEA